MSIKQSPLFEYGSLVDIGPDNQPADDWPTYVVADQMRSRRIADPDRPTRTARVFEVFLARQLDWPQFIPRL